MVVLGCVRCAVSDWKTRRRRRHLNCIYSIINIFSAELHDPWPEIRTLAISATTHAAHRTETNAVAIFRIFIGHFISVYAKNYEIKMHDRFNWRSIDWQCVSVCVCVSSNHMRRPSSILLDEPKAKQDNRKMRRQLVCDVNACTESWCLIEFSFFYSLSLRIKANNYARFFAIRLHFIDNNHKLKPPSRSISRCVATQQTQPISFHSNSKLILFQSWNFGYLSIDRST